MTRILLVGATVTSVAMSGMLLGWDLFTRFVAAPAAADRREVLIAIPERVNAARLAHMLHEQGLVSDRRTFEWYAKYFRNISSLEPGEYALAATMSPAQILDRIERGTVVTYTVSIPAGWRASEIVRHLAAQEFGDKDALIAMLKDPTAAERLGVPSASLEGFLFPDAYNLPRGLDPQVLVGELVERYNKRVSEKVLREAEQVGLDEHALITLASLIEVDNVPQDERAMLSAVYHNRLKDGMALENSGSVAYGLGKPLAALTRADLDAGHAWNTFRVKGLPPTPVASPSLASIVAASRPAKSDVKYFAPRGDTTHIFCPDAECHRLVLERWRREQASSRSGNR